MPPGVEVQLAELIALRAEARGLDLAARQRVLATRAGGHLSRLRGRGMEFDESRPYQPGDDPRHMDWRVTARRGQAHIKRFREERERPLWLLVDQGPTMRFGTRVAFKSVIAARAAALLGWAAAEQGDRVGGLVFDEQRHFEQRPRARSRGLLPLLHALAGGRTRGVGLPGPDAAAHQLAGLVRPGGLVCLLSDFHDLDGPAPAWLGALTRHSEVILIAVHDPLEATPPPPGLYPAWQGRHRQLLDTRHPGLRRAWQQHHDRRQQALRQLARQHACHLIELRTDQPLASSLRQGLSRGAAPPRVASRALGGRR